MIDKLTIGMFQSIREIPKEHGPVKRGSEIASILSNLPIEEIRQWHPDKLKKHNLMFTTINFKPYENKIVKSINIANVNHRIVYRPNKMTSGQLIDIIELFKKSDDPISYMHEALAILTINNTLSYKALSKLFPKDYPPGYDSSNVRQRAEDIKNILVRDVWGVWVFFWNLWIRYYDVTEDYLSDQMMNLTTEMKAILKNGGHGS